MKMMVIFDPMFDVRLLFFSPRSTGQGLSHQKTKKIFDFHSPSIYRDLKKIRQKNQ